MTPRAQAMFVDRTQPPVQEATQFSEQEINALLLIKPTPYLDEPDLPEYLTAIPSVDQERLDVDAYMKQWASWWDSFFGKETG